MQIIHKPQRTLWRLHDLCTAYNSAFLFCHIYFSILCKCVCMHVLWHMCGGQGAAFGEWTLSYHMLSGINLRLSGLASAFTC